MLYHYPYYEAASLCLIGICVSCLGCLLKIIIVEFLRKVMIRMRGSVIGGGIMLFAGLAGCFCIMIRLSYVLYSVFIIIALSYLSIA